MKSITRIFFASLIFFTIVNGLVNIESIHANEGEDIEENINSLREEQKQKEKEADKTDEELKEIEKEITIAEDEIRKLDENMADTNQQIDTKQSELDETNDRVDELRIEIEELEESIAERDKLLKDRVKSMYQGGGSVNYIEVILGSQSFGDLIERVSALHSIAEQDRNILEKHVEDMQSLENAKQSLENELASLEEQMKELQELQANLEDQLQQKDVLVGELQAQGYELEENLMSIEEERSFLKAQEEAAEAELAAWKEEQRRLEEERRKKEEERRKREEERKAEEKAKEKASQANSSSETTQASSGGSATFHRPANGRVTSNYNPNRLHPVHGTVRPHTGTDFGWGGGKGIYAAEAGTVISAGRKGGFGNTIMISHVVDGKSVTTLYAHLASFKVSAGQRVSRGQNIATMGTTGVSTGVHLHFEVHPGGYSGKASAVNPSSYLP